jgi:hypothetical protein
VVAQDTGFGEVLPTGEGLFGFREVGDAAAALDEIEADPERHSAASLPLGAAHGAAKAASSTWAETSAASKCASANSRAARQ